MARIKPLVAGNWKMNGISRDLGELKRLTKSLKTKQARCEVMLCPPATLLSVAAQISEKIVIGGQDCHANSMGAHTGDISAAMLHDAGARAVILGHSERRTDHTETSKGVCAKVIAAHQAKLTTIICVGENITERKAGKTIGVIRTQLKQSLPKCCTAKNTVVAYEPIWAIGTGLTPTPKQIGEVHKAIRTSLARRFGEQGAAMRLLYGGSVKPDNAASILAIDDVNGALVGGASLKARDFLKIIDTYR